MAGSIANLRLLNDTDLPLALADLHRDLATGESITLQLKGDGDISTRLSSTIEGGGFAVRRATSNDAGPVVAVRRLQTLPDIVGPGMRLLVCGLNPSLYAADVGVGFARPGNRFWPAALAAGLASVDRDPRHALDKHGVGFTDLVKRATRQASELGADEYRHGARRLNEMVQWLEPATVCFVGLTGYRVAVDRKAVAGWQQKRFGGRPTYLMGNPSGINAHATLEDITDHLRRATGPAETVSR